MLENMPLVQHLLVYRKVDLGSIMKWEDYAAVHLELLWGSGRCLLIGKTNRDHKSQSFMPTELSPIRLRLQAFQATKQKDLPTSAAQRAADFNSRGDGGWKGWVGSWGQRIKSKKHQTYTQRSKATQTPMQEELQLTNATHDRIGRGDLYRLNFYNMVRVYGQAKQRQFVFVNV